MTQREQFEAAIRQLAEQPESSFEKPYGNDDADAHWAVWQASRRSALEEALGAVLGERLEDPSKNADDIAYDMAVDDCAIAIRALADSNGGKS